MPPTTASSVHNVSNMSTTSATSSAEELEQQAAVVCIKTPTRQRLFVSSSENTPVNIRQEVESRLDVETNHNNDDQDDDDDEEEDAEAASLELARALMAEEAMTAYQQHFQLLQDSINDLSQEDYDALQAVLEEDQQEQVVAELEDEEGELSYETLLQLSERMGDVKSERWAMIADRFIEKLPMYKYTAASSDKNDYIRNNNHHHHVPDDSACKCLVCQCEYEEGDNLRRLPCGHCFHTECVDQWLKGKDVCPYCRQCIRKDDDGDKTF